jgi:hypothetical protein
MRLEYLEVPGYVSIRTAAETHLGCSLHALRLRIRRGAIKATRFGPSKLFLKIEDVERMREHPPVRSWAKARAARAAKRALAIATGAPVVRSGPKPGWKKARSVAAAAIDTTAAMAAK